MSRKTSGALQIQLQTVVQAMEEAISKLIEKVDTLGGKIDKMPNVAKKMADGYVASFGTIAKSVEGLSSHVNKLDKIASGLTKIADGVKSFKVTEAQAKSIDRLTQSFAALGPAVAGFPKDVSGLSSFSDSITSITTALEGMDGKIPSNAQIDRLNRAANAIRNTGNALKSVGTIPPDAMAMFQSMNRTGGSGTGGGGGTRGGVAGDEDGPAAESSEFSKYAAKGIGVAVSFGITEALKRQNVNKELSQVMAFENSTLGKLIPGSDGEWKPDSAYTAEIKQNLAAQQLRHGVNYEDAASALALTARYTAGGNGAYGDVRSLAPGERIEQQSNLIGNSKFMNQATGLDMSSAANMQLYMGRDLSIKAEEYTRVKDAFVQVQRAGALTAKDLEKLSANARDSGMALNLVGDEAASYVTERLKSATALATAGIKASDAKGTMAGFFGDEGSFIFDMLSGITDADYKSGNEANLLKKQYAGMGMLSGGMGNDREGNYRLQSLINMGVHPASITSAEQFRTVSGKLDEVSAQQVRLDAIVEENAAIAVTTTMMEDLSISGQKVVGIFGGIAAAFGQSNAAIRAATEKALPENFPGRKAIASIDMGTAMKYSNPMIGPFLLGLKASKGLWNAAMGGEKPEGYARGGVVKPGASGETDSVPIMATPGEEVLSKSDPRHSNNALGYFKEKGYRVTSGYRDDNPKSDHFRGRAVDIGMGHLKSPEDIASFKEKILADATEQGLKVHFEKMNQFNPGTGSVSSGMHAHVYGDMRKLGGAFERVGAGRLDSGRLLADNNTVSVKNQSGAAVQAPSLVESAASNTFSALSGLISAQKAQQQAPLQLDPSVMSTLSSIASSNSGSSDTMAQAVSMFAQVIQRLVSRSSSSGSDLTEAVARGNYAFSRGA